MTPEQLSEIEARANAANGRGMGMGGLSQQVARNHLVIYDVPTGAQARSSGVRIAEATRAAIGATRSIWSISADGRSTGWLWRSK